MNNLADLCRLCTNPQFLDEISFNINDMNIKQKLIDCCRWNNFEEMDNEDLPQNVCTACTEKLEQCWSFSESVADAQHSLLKIIEELKTEPENLMENDPIEIDIDFQHIDLKDDGIVDRRFFETIPNDQNSDILPFEPTEQPADPIGINKSKTQNSKRKMAQTKAQNKKKQTSKIQTAEPIPLDGSQNIIQTRGRKRRETKLLVTPATRKKPKSTKISEKTKKKTEEFEEFINSSETFELDNDNDGISDDLNVVRNENTESELLNESNANPSESNGTTDIENEVTLAIPDNEKGMKNTRKVSEKKKKPKINGQMKTAVTDSEKRQQFSISIPRFPDEVFLKLLKPEHLNDDGSIKPEQIVELELDNWMMLQHQCYICGACLGTYYKLKSHFMTEHPGDKMKNLCSLCTDKKVTLNRQPSLYRHTTYHLPHLKHCCWKCNKFYWDMEKLQTHIASHRNKNSEDAFRSLCDICGKSFNNESAFRTHAHFHKPDELRQMFECYMCRKIFKSKLALRYHMNNHFEMAKYICDICNFTAGRKDSLKRHLLRHSDVYPFGCPHCDKKFKTKQQSNNHIRIHTDERPYKCNICEYRTGDSGNMHKHTKKHGASGVGVASRKK